MMEPTGLCAQSLAKASTWSTAWCARMSVALAAATALLMMAMPASDPLISVPIIIDAAPRRTHSVSATPAGDFLEPSGLLEMVHLIMCPCPAWREPHYFTQCSRPLGTL